MAAAGEQAEHARCIGCIFRLPENLAVDSDGSIGAEDDKIATIRGVSRKLVECGLRFFACEACHVGNGVFAGKQIFSYMRGMNLKGKAGLREQFAPAR